jgi:chemotaxis protein CheD
MFARPDTASAGTRGYFDPRFNARIINVPPGGHDITAAPGEILSTVLGSCVAACLRDTQTGIGGMNHFLLPCDGEGGGGANSEDMRFGVAAMEVLINALLRRGALRGRLEAKVFGGAWMLTERIETAVGSRNAAFVLQFLANENIPVVAQDLGGPHPRRANYEPATGRAWVNRISAGENRADIDAAEQAYRQKLRARNPAANLEIF